MSIKKLYLLSILSILLTIINAGLLAQHLKNAKVHILTNTPSIVTNSTAIVTNIAGVSSQRLIIENKKEYINVPIADGIGQTHILKDGTIVKIE